MNNPDAIPCKCGAPATIANGDGETSCAKCVVLVLDTLPDLLAAMKSRERE